jgi:tellurite resistance protein
MRKEEKIYEVLGEMLYVVAMADGVIQVEEKDALQKFFGNHSQGEDVVWSFEYEESHKSSIDDVYNKVIDYCHNYGSSPVYVEFITAMQTIAEAANGIDDNESKIINSFSNDLLERFQKDAEKLIELKNEE